MARRARRDGSGLKRLQSWAFYRLFSYLTDLEYDGAVSNFSISARRVIDDVLRLREAVRYFPGFLFWLGYPSAFIDVTQDPRFAGETTYTFVKLLRHSLDIILAYSNKPLRLCVKTGFIIAILAFVGGVYYLGWALLYGYAVSGWASLIISLYFLSGVIILTLGIVGLYVDKIFAEVKQRPHFVIQTRTFDE
jgi:dolichol-phosphate mannosyltransferase